MVRESTDSIYKHTRAHTRTHTHAHTHTHSHTHNTRTHTRTHNTHTHTRTHAHTHTRAHTHTHAHTYTRAHIQTHSETCGAGVETQKKKRILYHYSKKTKTKNLISPGRRHLLQRYWYKVPVLHLVKYHLRGLW